MPKEIINLTLERSSKSDPWGFVIIGGKDQALTVKVGRVKAYSPAEKAGLKTWDYIYTINGKEVFDLSHNQCVEEVKKAGNTLALSAERGDHIVPHFEEIWPSKKKKAGVNEDGEKTWDYYFDAMQNGPQLSGHLPIPANFTTVGKPQIFVNQYDSPIQVYSEDTIEEMKGERLTLINPDYLEKKAAAEPNTPKAKAAAAAAAGAAGKVAVSDNPFAAQQAKSFDTKKSNVLGMISNDEKSRGK